MNTKLFVRDDCPRCLAALEACEGLAGIEIYNVGEVDGLAEASFYGVLATPSVLVLDGNGREIVSWRGALPDRMLLARYSTLH